MYTKNMLMLAEKHHPECIYNFLTTDSLFKFDENGILCISITIKKKFQGYQNRIHGGILSGLLDSVMTRFLFGHNIVAYTVRLNIKYSGPVIPDRIIQIKVSFYDMPDNYFCNVTAVIYQEGNKVVKAEGKFWIKQNLDSGNNEKKS